ncbi:very short patch repair endonuclease [Knoellia sp. CPCC 206450]|uniref:very short patch repair endonuclease n=1 Tax=Knoellia tibetensis TaxID=3404798 RepID=UPI003B439ED8
MSALARRDTRPEMELRRALHARGYRYRVQSPVPGLPRRRIDIAFPRRKVAIFVDGCFWHGCPDHCRIPSTNREWWEWKIARTQSRDADTDRHLAGLGWTVVRAWEHEVIEESVRAVKGALEQN